ncbi:hypothetical protein [Legionella jordanis]|uniref:Uncharacterized protein n=1 Tax=Legionella jordanis TaxID=456 RepID=A0A0W0VE82_9GAMM|nr:hypothetical protein [Legionella jordanis]KTD18395.1 hypothetical protein Ljor_2701 [Legionella jordanis]RMX05303.1 hypothetical protein EAW55_01170 [Legionella jordanis]RMX20846.1 hypothetical protein EAS68_05875 [Legionella jordanis]VEH13259.1 Uncharacterised protein [Legionella jordanis]
MKGHHNGIDYECLAQKSNGRYAAEYLLIFHYEQYTYVVKKSVGKTFPSKKEAEIKAMEIAKMQIEKGFF